MRSILQSIKDKQIDNVDNVVVISNNSEAPGLKIAQTEYNVKTETLLKRDFTKEGYDKKLLKILDSYGVFPDKGLICLAGFMQILSPLVVDTYKHRILNIHPSLLPSFKGLHAQKQALQAGVKISGCTVHFVDIGVDTGPIIIQKCVPVFDHDDEVSLSDRILLEEHKIYPEAINLFTQDKLRVMNGKVYLL